MLKDELLFADANIKNGDVGFAAMGQSAKVKLAAYPFQRHGMLRGTVIHICADVSEPARAEAGEGGNNGQTSGGACKRLITQLFQVELFSISGVIHMRSVDDQIFLPRVKVRFIGPMILSVIATLTGCYYPLAADDFTVLNNDVLSDLLRNSYGSGNQTGGNSYGALGPGRLDKSKLELLVSNLFVEKKQNKIEAVFLKNEGKCITGVIQKEIACNFVRKWKLKNIGAPFDTSNWSDPAAKIEIRFMFDEHGKMRNLSLEIIDVTEYKKIKG